MSVISDFKTEIAKARSALGQATVLAGNLGHTQIRFARLEKMLRDLAYAVVRRDSADVEKYMRRLVIRGDDDATSSDSNTVVRSIAPLSTSVEKTNSRPEKAEPYLQATVSRAPSSGAQLGRARAIAGKKGGASCSMEKAAAARKNGAKGGRPKKKPT